MTKTRPAPGDIIFAHRGLYKHYGVYIGNGTVIHFAGDASHEISARDAFVQKTSLKDFLKGAAVQTDPVRKGAFSPKQTVMRAMQAIGSCKGSYHLCFNNCEHFANWCKYGKRISEQVHQYTNALAQAAVCIVGGMLVKNIIEETDLI